jgi:TPR repeat protein
MGRHPSNNKKKKSKQESKTTTNASQSQPTLQPESANVTSTSTDTASPEVTTPAPLPQDISSSVQQDDLRVSRSTSSLSLSQQDDLGHAANDKSKYDQYLEDRAKHMDELDAVYKSWKKAKLGPETPQLRFQLALIHLNNSHPSYPPNTDMALKYLRLAADKGHSDSHAYIAFFHLAGIVLSHEPPHCILHVTLTC